MYYTIRYTKSVRKDKWLVLSTCKRNILGLNRALVKKIFWPLVQLVQNLYDPTVDNWSNLRREINFRLPNCLQAVT